MFQSTPEDWNNQKMNLEKTIRYFLNFFMGVHTKQVLNNWMIIKKQTLCLHAFLSGFYVIIPVFNCQKLNKAHFGNYLSLRKQQTIHRVN